jgi:uncharacterized membrane protein YgdD (TMEM256/DUF423 family)
MNAGQEILMTPRQQAFALIASVALLVLIVEMVRRRRLREEYSWLWILTGAVIFVLSVWYGALLFITHLIGAVTPVSTFFMFGILFLVVTNIYFSIKVSTLTTQVKNLAQRLAIMDSYLKRLREQSGELLPVVNSQSSADAMALADDCESEARGDT